MFNPKRREIFGGNMKIYLILAVCLSLELAHGQYQCGIQPIPKPGCTVGRCINGQWEQNCDQYWGSNCGFKPTPKPGCSVGSCVNGEWQQNCDQSWGTYCGSKPIPAPGCVVGSCISGKWEQICN